jgi:hypothetical protein
MEEVRSSILLGSTKKPQVVDLGLFSFSGQLAVGELRIACVRRDQPTTQGEQNMPMKTNADLGSKAKPSVLRVWIWGLRTKKSRPQSSRRLNAPVLIGNRLGRCDVFDRLIRKVNRAILEGVGWSGVGHPSIAASADQNRSRSRRRDLRRVQTRSSPTVS